MTTAAIVDLRLLRRALVSAGLLLAGSIAGPAADAVAETAAATKPGASAKAKAKSSHLVWTTPGRSASSKALDRALAPLMSRMPDDAELDQIETTIEAIYRRDFATADTSAAGVRHPAARKLITWYRLRMAAPEATPEALDAFRRKNPDWPGKALREEAEEYLFANPDTGRTLAFFKERKPETGPGKAALASALLASGDRTAAQKLAVAAWREEDFGKDDEAEVLRRLGDLLGPADHRWRLDRYLYSETRWETDRENTIARIKRVIPLLSEAEQAKANVRLAVYRCGRNDGCVRKTQSAFSKLPAAALKDWGVAFHRIQMLRRTGKETAAWELLAKAPTEPKSIVSPDDWWVERRVNAYLALYAREPRTAYKLAVNHGPLSVNPLKEAEFLAGWIALRFLGDPKAAEPHFQALRKVADGPNSLAQADYWLGRTYMKLGKEDVAAKHYAAASVYFNAYYGQLARQTLDSEHRGIDLTPTPVPGPDIVAAFLDRDVVQAIAIARKAGLNDLMRVLAGDLRYKLAEEHDLILLAHLALDLGDTQMSVRIAKTAMEKGFNLTEHAYPVHAMPDFTALRPLPERSVLYALARQESEFNTLAVSGSGARGILQIMPATARGVCSQYKVKCATQKLLSDPAFNAALASAYIADRQDDFAGSYIMAIAGYNAGPGRVRQWVEAIGDPRSPSIDPVDWIELIHIEETREYVKKVLSNIQVYRARLGNEKTALRIREDLARARAKARTAEN